MSDITLGSVQQVLGNALSDPSAASQLLADPAAFFRQNGLDLSQGQDAEFNQYFQDIDPDLLATLSEVARGQVRDREAALPQGWSCQTCMTGMLYIARLFVPHIETVSALTPESAVVVALAEYAGIEAESAANFLNGLLPMPIPTDPITIATKICKWLHAC